MTRRGFTLLEVVIVIGITTVLVSTLGLFVSQIASTRTSIRNQAEREAGITMVFDVLEDALVTSVARSDDGGSGILGDSLSIEVSFEGTTIQRALGTLPERVLVPEDRVRITFSPSSGEFSLQRDKQESSTLGVSVFAARIRYFDGELWYEEWDSIGQSSLPVAVEISVWFRPWPNEEIPAWFPEELAVDEEESSLEEETYDSFGTLRELDEREDLPEPDRRRFVVVPDAVQVDESVFFEEGPISTELEEVELPE